MALYNNRTLTVDRFYHYYIPDKDAPPGTSNRSVAVPCIYFKGRWLEQAGFKIGSMVKIHVRPGRLVLRPVQEDPHNEED